MPVTFPSSEAAEKRLQPFPECGEPAFRKLGFSGWQLKLAEPLKKAYRQWLPGALTPEKKMQIPHLVRDGRSIAAHRGSQGPDRQTARKDPPPS